MSKQLPAGKRRKSSKLIWMAFIFLILFLAMLAGSAAIGGMLGYAYGQAQRETLIIEQSSQQVQVQYELALTDIEAGRWDVARQRFEWVLDQEPNYPGAVDKLAEAMAVLYATATPTPVPPTLTPTPTRESKAGSGIIRTGRKLFSN